MKKYENFIFFEKKKFIFSYIPKVACTNWKCIFRYMNGSNDYLNCDLAHSLNSGLIFLSDLDNSNELLLNSEIKKYSCVRNPYSRLLSAYLNKINPFVLKEKDEKDYYYNIFNQISIYKQQNYNQKEFVDFECFVNWLFDLRTYDPHWESQTKLIHFDTVKYDFIARLENLQDDADFIFKKINCDISFPTQDQIKFQANNSDAKLLNFYTRDLKEKVDILYSEDFSNFFYSKTLTSM
jgi:hypothetical protein